MLLNWMDILDGAIANAAWGIASMAAKPHTSHRVAVDLEIATWADTGRLIKDALADIQSNPQQIPDLTESEATTLDAALKRNEVQGALQALLASRLTDAPEAEAASARTAVCLALGGTIAPVSTLPPQQSFDDLWDEARENGEDDPIAYIESHWQDRFSWYCRFLSDYFDDRISNLVSAVEGRVGFTGLAQVRAEAFSSRLIAGNARIEALLGSLDRQVTALTEPTRHTKAEIQFIDRFQRQVQQRHGFLVPPDFDRRRRVPVDDIYVSTGISEVEFSGGELSIPKTRLETLKVWDLVGRIGRTVLLGDPGGGKTTAANALTARFASDAASRIPFLVTLREYAAKAPVEWSIVECIEHNLKALYQSPAPDGLVERLLLTGRAIVIFDGLDELLDTSRRRDVSDRVEQFCTAYPLTPVLVTSRVSGYDQARLDDSQFVCYRLGSFGDDEVAEYAHKWFTTQEGIATAEAEAKTTAFLAESSNTKDLRSNPLLLSLMCILYRGVGSLPRDRAGIYAKCAELLLRKWDEQRELYRKLDFDHLVEPTLRYLAWWLFTREDSRTTATERELVAKATDFLHGRGYEFEDEARIAAQKFVEFCRGRMWVFSDAGTSTDGEKLYGFTHRTFLEYFTAFHLAVSCDTPEALASLLASRLSAHVAGQGWDVVGELSVQIKSSVSDNGADRIFHALLKSWQSSPYLTPPWILTFVCRCIGSAGISPATVRIITQSACDYSFVNHSQPLMTLISHGGRYTEVITEEVCKKIAHYADDPEQLENTLNFLLYADELYGVNWPDRAREQALIAFTNLGRAIYNYPGKLQVSWSDADWWDYSGHHIMERLLSFYSGPEMNELTALGIISLSFMVAEMYDFDWSEFLGDSKFRQPDDIYCYLSRRATGQPNALPGLPVPNEFKIIFQKWATKVKNFLNYVPIE